MSPLISVQSLPRRRPRSARRDLPRSLSEFQHCFPDEPACAAYLFAARWPHGFVCPSCGKTEAWELQTKPWTYECAGCGKQTSVTAGTIIHHSKLPLTTWFWAAYLMDTHSNGISALQLQRQLALGSYKSAWLLSAKLRRSMLAPGRTPLAGLVEVDETEIACRSKKDPLTGGGGRRRQGKILIVGAVEVQDGGAGPGRIRLKEIPDYITQPPACTRSWPPISPPGPPRRPTGSPVTPAPPASIMIPTSSARWRPTSSCLGCTASSPTTKSGRSASITAYAATPSVLPR